MTQRIIDFVRELIGNDYFTTLLIAIIPIVELRGAIPAAITMKLSPWIAFALAWVGSAIVSPILLLILRPVLNKMKKTKAFASLASAVESGFKSKAMKVVGAEGKGELSAEAAKKLERKKMLGVYLFVAFPIPLTGVWTGSAVATFLDLPFFKSMAMVWLGNLTAGAIVTVLAVFLESQMNIVLDVFFVIVIIVLLAYIVRIVLKIVKNKKIDNGAADDAKEQNIVATTDGESAEKSDVAADASAREVGQLEHSATSKVAEKKKEE